MGFNNLNDFRYELETDVDQKIDSVRDNYDAMFNLVERKRPPIRVTFEIDKVLKSFNIGINKAINTLEKFIKEVEGMWDYSFEDFVKDSIESDPDLEKDDISHEMYMEDMRFITDDYFDQSADEDLVQSVKDAKEWEWDDEYQFSRKFKKYTEDLYAIESNLANKFQDTKHSSMISIFVDTR